MDAEKFLKLLKPGYSFEFCKTCAKAKSRAKPHPISETENPDYIKGSHFSIDLCGPFSTLSAGGKRYFMIFVDKFTRRGFIYFLGSKDEADEILNAFIMERLKLIVVLLI